MCVCVTVYSNSSVFSFVYKSSITYMYTKFYRALQVTCQRLEAWLSCYVECHHGNASLNQVTTTPNLIKALHNLFRRPQLQTKSFPIPYFN